MVGGGEDRCLLTQQGYLLLGREEKLFHIHTYMHTYGICIEMEIEVIIHLHRDGFFLLVPEVRRDIFLGEGTVCRES